MTSIPWKLTITLWAVATVAMCQTSDSAMTFTDVLRYFPNSTLTYWQFACSKPEQACFKENKLLFEADGSCYSVGLQGPCSEGEIFHADKEEASRKGGHLRGTCEKPCPGVDHAPLAATGECMSKDDVQSKICRSELYLRPAMDVFGQWVCKWTALICQPRESYPAGGFPGEYSTYNGICSLPTLFNSLVDDGENATVPAETPADHPLYEYLVNNTIPDREFPCTEEEKACLQYGRLWDKDGNCYSPNRWNTRCENGETFHLDWNEAMKEGGKLTGTCRSPCKDYKHPQIKTGECVDYSDNSNKICRYEWGMSSEVDVYGRMGCSCLWTPDTPAPPPPSPPAPASNPGHCTAPDFSRPIEANSMYDATLTLGFQVPCSEEEFACLQEGKVLAMGACHALRTRGPCAESEQLVLDKEALAHAQLKAKCAPSPCPEGSVLVPIDGQCLTHQQVISLLCPGQHVALDEFGGWQCDFQVDNWPGNLTSVVRQESDRTCLLPEKYGQPSPHHVSAYGVGSGRPDGGFARGQRPLGGFHRRK